jgi:protein-tyrosine-phosphatase
MRPTTRILVACTSNAVRSPIAAALLSRRLGPGVEITSAGVRRGAPDPFAAAVLAEIGLAPSRDPPRSFADLAHLEFDLVIALSPEAEVEAAQRVQSARHEYWPTPDATTTHGNRDQRLQAYRDVRDGLSQRIEAYFAGPAHPA